METQSAKGIFQIKKSSKNLVKECYVEWKTESIGKTNLLSELLAQLPRRCCRVSQQCLCVAIHERDRQQQRLLGLGRLQLQPARRLVPRSVSECPAKSFLAVGSIARWAVDNEVTQVTHKLQVNNRCNDYGRQTSWQGLADSLLYLIVSERKQWRVDHTEQCNCWNMQWVW